MVAPLIWLGVVAASTGGGWLVGKWIKSQGDKLCAEGDQATTDATVHARTSEAEYRSLLSDHLAYVDAVNVGFLSDFPHIEATLTGADEETLMSDMPEAVANLWKRLGTLPDIQTPFNRSTMGVFAKGGVGDAFHFANHNLPNHPILQVIVTTGSFVVAAEKYKTECEKYKASAIAWAAESRSGAQAVLGKFKDVSRGIRNDIASILELIKKGRSDENSTYHHDRVLAQFALCLQRAIRENPTA
jgi:hypothetical protein